MPEENPGTAAAAASRTEEVRTIAVTRRALVVLAGVAALVLTFAGLAAESLLQAREPVRAETAQLRGQNAALASEIASLEQKLAGLDGQMSILLRRNEELRLLANLPPIPIEVQAVGVGGPGHASVGGLPEATDPLTARLTAAETDLDVILRRSRLLARSMSDAEGVIRNKTARWSATPSVWPTDGFLTSPFSYARKHPLLGSFRPHYGIDISARAGNKVVATADGRVIFAGWRNGSGQYVEVDHGFGIETTYSHNAKLLVKTGDRVSRGTPIAYVGSTGLSLAPHVHYEVHVHGQPVDPAKYIFPNVAD